METIFDINVDNGKATVTQTDGQAGNGLRFTIKSNDPKVIIIFEEGSPAELNPGKPQKVFPSLTLPVSDPAGPKKKRHARCGRLDDAGNFKDWEGGGFDTPPIGGGNLN